ncbi:hypothetical protein D621_11050 [beta proteobacterium AAP51]|nr:hypothetical protein D621_11050 [beta proteobacterium AAP51]
MSSIPPRDPYRLSQLALRLLQEAPAGVEVELPGPGTALENAFVYDAVARELLREAEGGRLEVVRVTEEGGLVRSLVFLRRV